LAEDEGGAHCSVTTLFATTAQAAGVKTPPARYVGRLAVETSNT
jgi:hypothetical protein